MRNKNSFLLAGRYLNKFSKKLTNDVDLKIKDFAKKWTELSVMNINEIDYYESFGEDLFKTILNLKKFNGRNGQWGMEKGHNNRFHDFFVGPAQTNDYQIVTAVEMKPPFWNLDIDLNDKGETALEQAINTSKGNVLLRNIIVSNFKQIRFYCSFFGYENYQEFTLDELEKSEKSREAFFAFLDPKLIFESSVNQEKTNFYKLVEDTVKLKKNKIDEIYGIYTSLLSNVSDELKVKDYFEKRQLSTLFINRFLFAEYAFQRGILDISVKEVLKDKSINSLHNIFSVLDKGGRVNGYYSPKFNGGLYHSNAKIDNLKISGNMRKELLKFCEVQLDDITPQILGQMFEQSLSADLSSIPGGPTESHSLGAVYTPSELARYMTRLSAEILGKNKLRVLDPACGSGVFLLESLKYFLGTARKKNSQEIEKIISNYIHGIDLNPAAVELTRFMIWHYVLDLDLPLPSINKNIFQGDTLFQDFSNLKKFDLVIGNPPFIAHQNMKRDYKDKLESHYTDILDPSEQYDISIAFFKKAYDFCKPNGIVSFISPNQLSYRPYAKKFRDYVWKNFNIERVVDLTEIKVFEHAAVSPFVYFFQKKKGDSKSFYFYTNIRHRANLSDAFDLFPQNTDATSNTPGEGDYLVNNFVAGMGEKFENASNVIKLSEIAKKPGRGNVGRGGKSGKVARVVRSKFVDGEPAKDSSKYSSSEFNKYYEKYNQNKIVMPRYFPTKFCASLEDDKTFVGTNVYYLLEDQVKDDSYCIKSLNMILNSNFFSIYDFYRSGSDRINEFGFRALDGVKFSGMEVPVIDQDKRKKIISSGSKVVFDSIGLLSRKKLSKKDAIKLDKTVEFEIYVASLYGVKFSKKEMKELLLWWSMKLEELDNGYEKLAA